jgi:trk system potassium uptake protein TrkH
VFSDSFQAYQGDAYVNTVLILLIVLGGLGFLVHLEVRQSLFRLIRGLRVKISLHTKMVLSMTLGLILVSLGLFLVIGEDAQLAKLAKSR